MIAQPASAEGMALAEAAMFNDPASQEGQLSLVLVNDGGNPFATVEPAPGTTPTPLLDITAASAVVVDYQYSSRDTPQGRLTSDDVKRHELNLQDAVVQLTKFQPGFQIHVYGLDGADLTYRAQTDGGVVRSIPDTVELSRGELGRDDTSTVPSGSDTPDFAYVERAGPMLIQDESAPRLRLTLMGDMVVEITGITVRAQDADDDATVESGAWREPLDPLPAGSEAAVFVQRNSFIRMVLQGAAVELGSDGGSPDMRWAIRETTSDFTGPVTLELASNQVRGANPDPDRTVIAAGSQLMLLPQADQVAVEVARSNLGTRGTLASVPAPASAALIGTGAILALAVAVGIGVLRRVLRLPALADVETAIEEGEYRKAARLAARILSRLPGSEEALLGRAIALSKAGRPGDVVTELTQHLALRPASDGTLHYVLGLAQLDVGQAKEGQASLREAVRRTPALQAEVAPRLGKAFSIPPISPKETHGYA
jgi:hypothetical protein